MVRVVGVIRRVKDRRDLMVCRIFIILICTIIFAHNSYSHGGRLAADG